MIHSKTIDMPYDQGDFIIDASIMQEYEEEYAKVVPTQYEMKYYGNSFRLRRAVIALRRVMKRRQLNLGVSFFDESGEEEENV